MASTKVIVSVSASLQSIGVPDIVTAEATPLTVTLTGTAQEKYFGPGDSITLVNKSQTGYPIAEANLLNKTYYTVVFLTN